MDKDQDHTDQETKISNTVHDKCLIRGIVILCILKPESDQQVRAKSNPLPSYKHHNIIGAHHEQQHEEYEEIQIREEFVKACIIMHVTNRIKMDQKSNTCDDQEKDR